MSSPAADLLNNEQNNESANGIHSTDELDDTSYKENPCCNPSVSDDEGSDSNNEVLRGDAIGDTLYSQRFVLSTLLKLGHLDKDLSETEELEKNLCDIWDMTVSKDVVMFLCSSGVIDLFTDIIKESDDKRLIEILVGIIGNLCNVKEAFQILWEKEDTIKSLLLLMQCRDSPTLIQLLRVIAVITLRLKDIPGIQKWYTHINTLPTFVHEISYMLYNSNFEMLLHEAFRALDAILSKFAEVDLEASTNCEIDGTTETTFLCTMFSNSELIHGTIEAFSTLCASHSSKVSEQSFLNVHCILTQFNADVYKPYTERLMNCLSNILTQLNDEYSLIVRAGVYNKDTLDIINDIFENLHDPLSKDCLNHFLRIWKIIHTDKIKNSNKGTLTNEFEDDEYKLDYNEYLTIILDFIKRQTINCPGETLKQIIQDSTKELVKELIKSLDENNTCDDYKIWRGKLQTAMETT